MESINMKITSSYQYHIELRLEVAIEF